MLAPTLQPSEQWAKIITCSSWGHSYSPRRWETSSHRKTQRRTASRTPSEVCPPSPTSSHSSLSAGVGSAPAIAAPRPPLPPRSLPPSLPPSHSHTRTDARTRTHTYTHVLVNGWICLTLVLLHPCCDAGWYICLCLSRTCKHAMYLS